jgi:hypothetical protein
VTIDEPFRLAHSLSIVPTGEAFETEEMTVLTHNVGPILFHPVFPCRKSRSYVRFLSRANYRFKMSPAFLFKIDGHAVFGAIYVRYRTDKLKTAALRSRITVPFSAVIGD